MFMFIHTADQIICHPNIECSILLAGHNIHEIIHRSGLQWSPAFAGVTEKGLFLAPAVTCAISIGYQAQNMGPSPEVPVGCACRIFWGDTWSAPARCRSDLWPIGYAPKVEYPGTDPDHGEELDLAAAAQSLYPAIIQIIRVIVGGQIAAILILYYPITDRDAYTTDSDWEGRFGPVKTSCIDHKTGYIDVVVHTDMHYCIVFPPGSPGQPQDRRPACNVHYCFF